jgi:methionine sulfoxide reductase heme-binding subunit
MGILVVRHYLIAFFSVILVYLFFLSRSEWDPMHSLNRGFADASLLLLILTLMIGPLGKISKYFNRFLSWRRELGIWSAITALFHVIIVFDGWFQWQLTRAIAGFDPTTGKLFFDPGFALANLIGLIGLVYVIMLALISNKKAIKLLGKQSWDYLQQKSTLLYLLVIIHTAYFLFFYRMGNPNWLQTPFLILVVLMFVLQSLAFFLHVRRNHNRSKT